MLASQQGIHESRTKYGLLKAIQSVFDHGCAGYWLASKPSDSDSANDPKANYTHMYKKVLI
jgi:hypothetical protein